jgi:hypothetical protein
MKVIDRRILRLEVRLRPIADDLSEERALGEMLLAGEWQRALQFLENQDDGILRDWQKTRRLTYGTAVTRFNFRTSSRMWAVLNASIADIPTEARYRIAELLLASDTDRHTGLDE